MLRMTFLEFVSAYCGDILRNYIKVDTILKNTDFSYDGIIEDNDGNEIKVVFVDNDPKNYIPIEEILVTLREDFIKAHPDPKALATYDNYISRVERCFGEEAAKFYRNKMMKLRESIQVTISKEEAITSGDNNIDF